MTRVAASSNDLLMLTPTPSPKQTDRIPQPGKARLQAARACIVHTASLTLITNKRTLNLLQNLAWRRIATHFPNSRKKLPEISKIMSLRPKSVYMTAALPTLIPIHSLTRRSPKHLSHPLRVPDAARLAQAWHGSHAASWRGTCLGPKVLDHNPR